MVLNGCVPLVMLMVDARRHHLGPDPIRSALQLTGFLALSLLVATLTITPLRTATGWNSLHSFRRPLGLMAFLYATSHLAIYLGFDQGWELDDAWNEITQRGYLRWGGAAWLAMLPLAVTSTPRMVRLLTIRRWKRLHRLIYASAIGGVIHYWMQSKADLRWQIAMVVVVIGLLCMRIPALRKSK